MQNQPLAAHEALEIHELLAARTVEAAKSATMRDLAGCERLRGLLSQDLQASKQQIRDLQGLLSRGSTF